MAISDHQKPLSTGFGLHTEPTEIMNGIDLSGKLAVITGGYSGIGLETTRAIAGAGAHVIVPVRSKEKADRALAELTGLAGKVEAAPMDLGDLASVRSFAEALLSEHSQVDILINNAGIMACPEARLGQNWEAQFATNHIGHAALFQKLEPALRKAGSNTGARVVALSSTGHKISPIRWDDIHFTGAAYDKWQAYGQSKTANALFAVGVDQRLKDEGVRAYAVHPGGIMTPLQRHLANEEMMALGWTDENGDIAEAVRPYFKTPAQGAGTTLWCATSPQLANIGGVYCENCDIAAVDGDPPQRAFNVNAHAVDTDEADRLWEETAKVLASA